MNWKVSKERVEVLPHDNAENLVVVKLGSYQVVAQKDLYQNNDVVVFFPEKSVMPDYLLDEETRRYLKGSEKNKVGSVRLRGEHSLGIVMSVERVTNLMISANMPPEKVVNFSLTEVGEDLSEVLNVYRYEPPVPVALAGKVKPMGDFVFSNLFHHDCSHLKTYERNLVENELVIATEKVHGCVTSSTKVKMSDGTWKSISKIKIGDEVIGYDHTSNKVVHSKVLGTQVKDNKNNLKWFNVKFSRSGNGNKSSFGSLDCTQDHKIFSLDRAMYVEAENLKKDERVYILGQNLEPSFIQKQVLIGKMLGDGSLGQQNNRLTFSHSLQEYTEFTAQALGDFAYYLEDVRKSGYGSTMYRVRTITSKYLNTYFENWFNSGKKEVPDNLVDEITPLALAFWYMDDGSLGHTESQEDRANIATCNFSENSIKTLIKCLEKFNIKATKQLSNNYFRLRLNKDEAEKFFILIAPYIPPFMQYKLPERFKGSSGFLPKTDYYPQVIPQKIVSVKEIQLNSRLYDIQTETENFFAHGLLIHNSQMNTMFVRDQNSTDEFPFKLFISSKGLLKRGLVIEEEEFNSYWQAYHNSDVLNKTKQMYESLLEEVPKGYIESIQIIGEVVPVQKGYDYGFTKPELLVYDVLVNGQSLVLSSPHLSSFKSIWVPILYSGVFNKEYLIELSKGLETVSDKPDNKRHIREGIVVRPVIDRRARDGSPLRLKIINPKYKDDDEAVN